MKARIAEAVHYVQPGSHDQATGCLAAIVTDSDRKTTVDLIVFDRRGQSSFKKGVAGERGGGGADTWHAATACPDGR